MYFKTKGERYDFLIKEFKKVHILSNLGVYVVRPYIAEHIADKLGKPITKQWNSYESYVINNQFFGRPKSFYAWIDL